MPAISVCQATLMSLPESIRGQARSYTWIESCQKMKSAGSERFRRLLALRRFSNVGALARDIGVSGDVDVVAGIHSRASALLHPGGVVAEGEVSGE